MIPRRSISLISNQLFKEHGGRRIPEQVIELDYCLAWFLVGLAAHPMNAKLAFKGGTALRRCHFGEYRFSEDLDFTLVEQMTLPEIVANLEEIFADVRQRSGIAMEYVAPDRVSHLNSHTFTIAYTGPLGTRKTVKVDMTINEKLVFALEPKPVIRTYEEYVDLPDDASVQCYSVAEVVVEKLVALSDPARHQPRDLYDLWYLDDTGLVDFGDLGAAVVEKLAHRNRTIDGLEEAIERKEATLKRLWKDRLEPQMVDLPEFDDVFRKVRRAIRQANFPAASSGV